MDKQTKQKARRIFAATLALTVMSATLPYTPLSGVFGDVAVTANAEEEWSKTADNTVFGTTGIEHPQAPQDNVEWRGNYVYYGKYDGNPMKYRILDADSQEFVPRKPYPNNDQLQDPSQKTLFLESDSTIGSWNFGGRRDWDSSVLKRQLVSDKGNLFLNKEGVFTDLERSSIYYSVKKGRSTGKKADGSGYHYGDYPANQLYYEGLWGDYIFVLDAVEATNTYYGYADADEDADEDEDKNVAHKSRDRDSYYWLRCTVCINSQIGNYAGAVDSDGLICHYLNRLSLPICPAFNVDLNKIIFSSRISGNASDTYGKEYKLTLKDDKFGINVTNGQLVTYNGSTRTVTVPYTVTDNDDAISPDTVSVLITNNDGKIVNYKSLTDVYSASGTASFTLPTNKPQNYHVYLLAEKRNGIYETDYASQPVEIHVPTTYGISYILNGGTNNSANPSSYIDTIGATLYEPTRDRYTFGGWYNNYDFSGDPVTSIEAGSSGSKKLYAKWNPRVYSVTLNKNGGTLTEPDVTQYTYTVGAKLPGITRDYYTFGNWRYRDSWGNEFRVTEIDRNSYGDKYYYAVWTANEYTIDYELNGGTASNPTIYTAETAMPFTLNNPTRPGYTFTGWTGTGINGISQNVVISDCSAGNRNYTANWSVNHYTVKFDKNNDHSTGTMSDMNFTYDEEQTLTANGFTAPTGYHFAGWATSPNGNVVYTDGQSVLNMTAEDNGVVTLYAIWEANTYTIHFESNANENEAYGIMPDQHFTYDEALKEISANAFIFTTAEFLGWATSPDGEVVYTDKQQIQNITAEDNAVITLYAQWHRRYRVNYDSKLFTCYINENTNNHYWAFEGDTVRINVTNPSVTYTFSIIDADGKNIEYSDYTFKMPEKEVWITISGAKNDIRYSSITLDDRDSWDVSAYLYDADNPTVTPIVTVMNGDTVLTEGTDYTLEIFNNTGSPDSMVEAVVLVTGKGEYYGTNIETFRITPFNIADCEIKGKLESYYTVYGVDGPLSENVEIWNGNTKLEYYEDYYIDIVGGLSPEEYEVGKTYHAIVTGRGDWGGTMTFEFEVVELYHTIVFDANGGTGEMANDIATNGYSDCRYYLPPCTFIPQYGYEFDYWTADCELDEDTGLPVHKQPGNYFTAPTLFDEYGMQTITVTAHWREKAKYTVTLPQGMELVSGNVDGDGKAYKDEVITFKASDGYTVFGDVKVGETTLTADANGIYTVTVADSDLTVTATKVLDDNTCYFDESTSTLHLRGNVNKTNVQSYKNSAVTVVADNGATLPQDSSNLFDSFGVVTSIDLSNADTSSVTNMHRMFRSCSELTALNLSGFNTSSVEDMSSMFRSCESLTQLDVSGFDTSSVEDMNNMFLNCNNLTTLDLSSFDTSSVTDMSGMFDNCYGLTTLDLSGFKTSEVTTMYAMFRFCMKLTTLDLSGFDTSSVTDMSGMFGNCSNLTTIYVSDNWNTERVTQSNVMFSGCSKLKGGNGTVYDSNNITHSYAVIDKDGQTGYLTGTYALTLPDDMEIVTDATGNKVGDRYPYNSVVEFRYTGTVPEHHYVNVKVRNTVLNADANGIYTLTVTDNTVVSAEIKACKYTVTLPNNMEIVGTASGSYEYGANVSFKAKYGYIVKNDVTANGTVLTADDNGVYTLTVTDNMTVSADVDVESYFNAGTHTLTLKGIVLNSRNGMILPNGVNKSDVQSINVDNTGATLPQDSSYLFYYFTNVTSIDLTGADTSSVTNMNYMFSWCTSLTSLDVSGFDTSSVTNMYCMFLNCSNLTVLDLSSFDTSSVTDMSHMFSSCLSFTSLDVSGFDASSVTDMSHMFISCLSLTSLDVSGFDASSVTDMSGMFWHCEKLTALDLSKFNTSSVTDMQNMFSWCTSLTSLNVSGFDTSSVTDMSNMFCCCEKLTALDLSSFDTSSVANMSYMFQNCSKLTTIYVSKQWSTDGIITLPLPNDVEVKLYEAMFDNCTQLKGGNNTVYDKDYVDGTRAVIDKDDQTGYLTGVYTVTVTETGTHCQITVRDANGMVIKNGDRVAYGTELTYEAVADNGYYMGVDTSNGNKAIMYKTGTVSVYGDVTITETAYAKHYRVSAYTTSSSEAYTFNPSVSCTETAAYGEEVTFTAYAAKNGFEFMGWYYANGKLASSELVYTMKITGTTSLNARYRRTSGVVTFMANGQQQGNEFNGTSITESDFPTGITAKFGYEFTGWDKTVAEINTALNNGENVTVNAIFAPIQNSFTVTIHNGSTDETVSCTESTLITRVAEKKDGSTFAYWTKDGELFTYNSKISFTANDTCTIIAVYTDNHAAETVKAAISKVTYADGKLIIAANMSVPEGMTVTSVGVKTATNQGMTEEPADNNVTTSTNPYEYAITIGEVAPNTTKFVQAYVTYKDTNGEDQTCASTVMEIIAGQDYDASEKGTAMIRSATYNSETKKAAFNAYLTVPENAVIVKAGLVASPSTSFNPANEVLTSENAQFVKSSSAAVGKCAPVNYNWNKSNVNVGDTWYARAYLVYTLDGAEHTVYGSLVTFTAANNA